MGCACNKRGAKKRFLWYSPENPEGLKPMVYNSELEAKAKKHRKGGKYIEYNANLSIGAQIVAAESGT